MKFIYTLDEETRDKLKNEGLMEIKTPVIINGNKAYCFKCEKEIKFSYSEKDKLVFSDKLFL